MAKRSAGLLPFRRASTGEIEVFIVHPGGPFWANKDAGAWSVAKGEYEPGEDPRTVAYREFLEELGVEAPSGRILDLGEVKQSGGKRVQVWAIEAPDFVVEAIDSNEFELEWPPRSGRMQRFPEVDVGAWFDFDEAKHRIQSGQLPILEELAQLLEERRS